MPRGGTGNVILTQTRQIELCCGKIYTGNIINVMKLVEMHKRLCFLCQDAKVNVGTYVSDPKYGKAGGCLQLKEM
jgi:hypothetical protein